MILLEIELEEFRIRLINDNDNYNMGDLFREFQTIENAYNQLRSNFENCEIILI